MAHIYLSPPMALFLHFIFMFPLFWMFPTSLCSWCLLVRSLTTTIISYSRWTLIVFMISIRVFWWRLGLGVVTPNAFGTLTGSVLFCFTWLANYPVFPPCQLLIYHYFCSVASSSMSSFRFYSMSTLVGSDVLGPVSGDSALHHRLQPWKMAITPISSQCNESTFQCPLFNLLDSYV